MKHMARIDLLVLFYLIVLIALAFCPAGCASVQVGLAAHPCGADRPEIKGERNPLGVVRLETKPVGRVSGFLLHISSIPVWERGFGYNMVGMALELKP